MGVCVSTAPAEDFKTINGKEYKDATVSRVEPDGIVLKTKSGVSKVHFTELPKDVQVRYNYNPPTATAHSAGQAAGSGAYQPTPSKPTAPHPVPQTHPNNASHFAQSPLDSSGEKKVTAQSEIERGSQEILDAAINAGAASLSGLLTAMYEVIKRNKSLQKDSDGFMLGARFEEIQQLDLALHLEGIGDLNTQEEMNWCVSVAQQAAKEVRELQKKLAIDDSGLADALNRKLDLFTELMSRYESKGN